MAFADHRASTSFNTDESDSDASETNSQFDTVLNTHTMSTPTATTTTATTTTTSGLNTSTTQSGAQNTSFARGTTYDNMYRANQTNRRPGQNSPPQGQISPPPVQQQGQPQQLDYARILTDPGFVQILNGIVTAAVQQQVATTARMPSPILTNQIGNLPNRSSSRLSDNMEENRTDLTQQMRNLRTASEAPTPPEQLDHIPPWGNSNPTYIPAAEQALQIHKNAAEAARKNADLFSGFAELVNALAKSVPNLPPEMPTLVSQFTKKALLAGKEAQAKTDGIRRAQRVTNYYETPIAKPAFPMLMDDRPIRVNHKELLMLTGYFDPADKSSDFKHTWQKLLDYASMNSYQEDHYMQALGSILKGEAYETFSEFKAMNKPLGEILDYFAGVYTKKRSLAADRKAVDEFTRKRGESIIVCMERAVLAIDKLRHLYNTEGWPALRQQMRQNILMQVVKEETKRAIQMEVDNVHEDTGMPYDFDKLIRFADRFERNHNSQPKEDVSTLFKVASGGIKRQVKTVDPTEQLSHLKKDLMLQKQIDTLQSEIKFLKTNESRMYKNEGRPERQRESRRMEKDSRSRQGRSQSYDRNRNLTSNTDQRSSPTTSSTAGQEQRLRTSSSSTTNPDTYKPPDPYRREQSKSPMGRALTPSASSESRSYRPRSNSYSRNNSRSRDGRDRDKYRSRSRDRYDYNDQPRSRTMSRSSSSNGTDHITSTGSKTVIITINGQDYVPLKKEN
jgi:hypothetical protein